MSDRRSDVIGVVFSRRALSRCVPTAMVVGTVLSAINQGATLLGGDADGVTWIRIAANYAVPFVVSNVGYVSASRSRQRSLPAGDVVDHVDQADQGAVDNQQGS